MTNTEVSPVETIVRAVLGVSYDASGFADESNLIAQIVEILEDETKRVPYNELGGMSNASEEIRELLWRYTGGDTSPIATCNLFSVLNRSKEVTVIAISAGYSVGHVEQIMRLAAERVGIKEWVRVITPYYATATETS